MNEISEIIEDIAPILRKIFESQLRPLLPISLQNEDDLSRILSVFDRAVELAKTNALEDISEKEEIVEEAAVKTDQISIVKQEDDNDVPVEQPTKIQEPKVPPRRQVESTIPRISNEVTISTVRRKPPHPAPSKVVVLNNRSEKRGRPPVKKLKISSHSKAECKVCGKVLSSSHSLRNHVLLYHESGTAEKAVCPECGKTLLQIQLHTHMKTHHSKDIFTCELCPNKKFKSTFSLRDHKKYYHEKKGFLCGICGQSFIYACRLQYHENEHRGLTPFACTLCPEKYSRPQLLQKHIKKVHEDPEKSKVQCPYCKERYKRDSLKDHINAHKGLKPYKCPDCDYSSSYSGACFTHRKVVHKNVGPDKRRLNANISGEEEVGTLSGDFDSWVKENNN